MSEVSPRPWMIELRSEKFFFGKVVWFFWSERRSRFALVTTNGWKARVRRFAVSSFSVGQQRRCRNYLCRGLWQRLALSNLIDSQERGACCAPRTASQSSLWLVGVVIPAPNLLTWCQIRLYSCWNSLSCISLVRLAVKYGSSSQHERTSQWSYHHQRHSRRLKKGSLRIPCWQFVCKKWVYNKMKKFRGLKVRRAHSAKTS